MSRWRLLRLLLLAALALPSVRGGAGKASAGVRADGGTGDRSPLLERLARPDATTASALAACAKGHAGGRGLPPGAAVGGVELLSWFTRRAVEEQRANETEAPTLPPAGGVGPLVALLQCAVRAGVHPRQYGGVLAEAAAAREHALLLEAIGHGGVASAAAAGVEWSPLHAAVPIHTQMASLAKECLARRSGRVGAWIDSVLPLVRERVGGQTAVAAEAAAVGLVAGMAAGRTQYSQAELRAVVGAWSAVFVAELIVAGANASAVDFAGRTPLHVAALAGNAPAAAQLVSRRSGAAAAAARALTALDRVRATAGDIAAARGHGDVLAVLQSSAARWEAPRGASAAEVAAGRAAVKRVLALLPAVPPRLRRPLLASPVATGGGRGSGGWGGEPTGGDVVRGCDIEQLASLTPKDFLERFYSPGVPVLLRGGAGAWPFRAEWTRDGFLASVGDVSFSAAAIPYPHFFGGNSSRVIAREFVAAMRYRGGNGEVPYIFERPALRELAPALLGHFPPIPPEFTLPPAMQQSPAQPQFFVGAPGSGAPVHFHADAWNAIAHGAKRWFLFPPATAFYSIVPAAQWFREHYGNLTGDARPLECVTEAGDLIFVPRDWGHGVLNLEETIGVASEFYSVFSRY